jgi:ABC-type sugar transport system substrate-binding protein
MWPVVLVAIFAMLLAACGGEAPTPTQVAPTATTAQAEATATTAQQAEPTATTAAAAEPTKATSGKDITVGLVQIDLSNPFHLGEVEGAKEAARRFGFELKVTSGEGDVNKQIQAFENLINEKVDVISVNFIDAKAFGPAMQKAKEANIPVVCLHSQIEGCATMLGFDERYTGNIVGEYAVKLLQEKYGEAKGNVANLQGLLGQGLNEDRTGGFTDIMAKYPNIKVVAKEPTNWDAKKAADITENWLTAYPDLDLIYGNSDSLTVPAANVIKRAGKLDQIMLVSVDGTESGLNAVKAGDLKSTVLLAPQYSGFWKVWVPYRVAQGEDVGDQVLIKGALITPDNVDAALKLAKDQVDQIQTFPFEKSLGEIVQQYTGGSGSSGTGAGGDITVGLVQIDLSNPFHLGEVEGAKEAARRLGFELKVTSGEGDVNKQIQAVENLINEKVDVISVNFIDIKAFGPTLQKAKDAGIPVVCLHSQAEGCATMLGFDERYTGNIVGEYAVKLLQEKYGEAKGNVANLQGLLGQGLNEDRTGGFTDVMAKYPNIKVVAKEPTNWDAKKAADITENWLTAYPDLDLIYGNSDSLTVPAANVIKRAGKLDQIMLVSVDGTESGLNAVKAGDLKSTVLLAPQYSGFWKVWVPYRVAKGENVGEQVLIKGALITPDNVDPAIKLAKDQVDQIQTFPFEKPLADIVSEYMNK